jgi:hypothetical protein
LTISPETDLDNKSLLARKIANLIFSMGGDGAGEREDRGETTSIVPLAREGEVAL